MIHLKRIPRVLRIKLILLLVLLVFYFLIGARVSALDNATRILGEPANPGFKLTLIYLLIHVTLIVLVPVHIAIRLTGFFWDRKFKPDEKE